MKRLLKTMLCIGVMGSTYSNFIVNANENEETQKEVTNELNLPVSQPIDFYAMDYTAPQVNEKSLRVDKQTVRPGEVVKVSLQVTDDISGVEDVQIQYEKPISKNKQWISLKYNYSTGLYEGSIFVDESTESGVWKIDCIVVSDYKDNTDWVYNIELNPYESGKNLSQGNFKVEGTEETADYTAPQVNEKSLRVDKQTVRPGEVVKVSLQVTDDISGVEDVQIQYEKPISKNKQWISLKYNYSTGLYEGSIFVDESTESGVWKIDCIVVSDYKDNTDWVYNIELNPYESGKNLSQGNFIVTQLIGSGWQRIDGTWYYLNESGLMATGWEKVNGTWYYFNKSGAMQTGWLREGNTWYYLKSSGAMATGWEQIGGVWYYFDGSGAMQTGWLPSGSTWYYLNESGAMVTGWEKIGSSWYYFNGLGVMQTGWLLSGSTWYYLNESGAMVTGWEQIGGVWYYFYSNGVMATNTVIDGWQITDSGAAYLIQ